MIFGDIMDRFAEQSPASVMFRGTLENTVTPCVGPASLDSLSDGGTGPTRRWMRTRTNQGESDNRAHDCHDARVDL